jgi:hypothetical protein
MQAPQSYRWNTSYYLLQSQSGELKMPKEITNLSEDAYGIQITGWYHYNESGSKTSQAINIARFMSDYTKSTVTTTSFKRDDLAADGTCLTTSVSPDGLWKVTATVFLVTSQKNVKSIEIRPNMTGSLKIDVDDAALSEGFDLQIIASATAVEVVSGRRLPFIPGESTVLNPSFHPPLLRG